MILNSEESDTTKTLAKGIVLYANKAVASASAVEPIVIANADSISSYYVLYTGGDTYLESTILSFARKMNQAGVHIATTFSASGTSAFGKPISVTTNGSITGSRRFRWGKKGCSLQVCSPGKTVPMKDVTSQVQNEGQSMPTVDDFGKKVTFYMKKAIFGCRKGKKELL